MVKSVSKHYCRVGLVYRSEDDKSIEEVGCVPDVLCFPQDAFAQLEECKKCKKLL